MLAIAYSEERGFLDSWETETDIVETLVTMSVEYLEWTPDWILLIENDKVKIQYNKGRDYE